MAKAAIVILAGTDTHADRGRMVNGLQVAKEFDDEHDDVRLIFDGAGTQWIPELEDPTDSMHEVYQALKGYSTVCDFCVSAFDVDDPVNESDVPRVADYQGHPSIRSLVGDGYEIITF